MGASPRRRIRVTSKTPGGDALVGTPTGTDAALGHGQWAEKVCFATRAPHREPERLRAVHVLRAALRELRREVVVSLPLPQGCSRQAPRAHLAQEPRVVHICLFLGWLRLSEPGKSAMQLHLAMHPRRNSNICNCCSLGRCKDRSKPTPCAARSFVAACFSCFAVGGPRLPQKVCEVTSMRPFHGNL